MKVDLDKPLMTSDGRAAVLRQRGFFSAFSVHVSGEGDEELWFNSDGTPMAGGDRKVSFTIVNAAHILFANVIVGLRQIAANLNERGSREVQCGDPDEHGLDLEAMPQYADRIEDFVKELADHVGYVEPAPEVSADVLWARELAARVLERLSDRAVAAGMPSSRIRLKPLLIVEASEAAHQIRAGAHDDSDPVQDQLVAINQGRVLAAIDAEHRRAADMAAKPAVPDRLTITIEGPQGCGKTQLADWLRDQLPLLRLRRPFGSEVRLFDPVVIDRD